MNPNIVTPVYKSVVRWTTDLIKELNALPGAHQLTYHDWENRADENKLPSTALFGVDGFAFDENQGLWIVRFGLTLSSHRDENLHNEMELLGEIQRRTGTGCKVPLREMVAGEQVSELKVVDWQLMPMGQSLLRNYRVIGIEVHRTGA